MNKVSLKAKQTIYSLCLAFALLFTLIPVVSNYSLFSSASLGFCNAIGAGMDSKSSVDTNDVIAPNATNRKWTVEELFSHSINFTYYTGEGQGNDAWFFSNNTDRGKGVPNWSDSDVQTKLKAARTVPRCIFSGTANWLSAPLWLASGIIKIAQYMMAELYNPDFICSNPSSPDGSCINLLATIGGTSSNDGGIIANLRDSIFFPLIAFAFIFTAGWLAWKGLIKREFRTSLMGVLWAVVVFMIGTGLMFKPQLLASAPQKVNSTIGSCLVGAMNGKSCLDGGNTAPSTTLGTECQSSADTNGDQGAQMAVNGMTCSVWKAFVLDGWSRAEFGKSYNDLYLKNAPSNGSIWKGAPKDVSPYAVHLQSSKSAENAKSGSKNYLQLDGGTAIYNLALYQLYISTQLNDTKNSSKAGTASYDKRWYYIIVPATKDSSLWDYWTPGEMHGFLRFGSAMGTLIIAIAVASSLIVFSFWGLIYSFAGTILMVFAPLFFLIAVEPEKGRRIFLGWLESIISSILKYMASALFVILALALYSSILSNTNYISGMLGTLIMVGVLFTYRKEVMNILGSARLGGQRMSNAVGEKLKERSRDVKEFASVTTGSGVGALLAHDNVLHGMGAGMGRQLRRNTGVIGGIARQYNVSKRNLAKNPNDPNSAENPNNNSQFKRNNNTNPKDMPRNNNNNNGNDNNTGNNNVIVPDLIGLGQNEASALLASQNLIMGSVDYQPSNRPENTVITSTPSAGTSVPEGTSVSVTLAQNDIDTPNDNPNATKFNKQTVVIGSDAAKNVNPDDTTTYVPKSDDVPNPEQDNKENNETPDNNNPGNGSNNKSQDNDNDSANDNKNDNAKEGDTKVNVDYKRYDELGNPVTTQLPTGSPEQLVNGQNIDETNTNDDKDITQSPLPDLDKLNDQTAATDDTEIPSSVENALNQNNVDQNELPQNDQTQDELTRDEQQGLNDKQNDEVSPNATTKLPDLNELDEAQATDQNDTQQDTNPEELLDNQQNNATQPNEVQDDLARDNTDSNNVENPLNDKDNAQDTNDENAQSDTPLKDNSPESLMRHVNAQDEDTNNLQNDSTENDSTSENNNHEVNDNSPQDLVRDESNSSDVQGNLNDGLERNINNPEETQSTENSETSENNATSMNDNSPKDLVHDEGNSSDVQGNLNDGLERNINNPEETQSTENNTTSVNDNSPQDLVRDENTHNNVADDLERQNTSSLENDTSQGVNSQSQSSTENTHPQETTDSTPDDVLTTTNDNTHTASGLDNDLQRSHEQSSTQQTSESPNEQTSKSPSEHSSLTDNFNSQSENNLNNHENPNNSYEQSNSNDSSSAMNTTPEQVNHESDYKPNSEVKGNIKQEVNNNLNRDNNQSQSTAQSEQKSNNSPNDYEKYFKPRKKEPVYEQPKPMSQPEVSQPSPQPKVEPHVEPQQNTQVNKPLPDLNKVESSSQPKAQPVSTPTNNGAKKSRGAMISQKLKSLLGGQTNNNTNPESIASDTKQNFKDNLDPGKQKINDFKAHDKFTKK